MSSIENENKVILGLNITEERFSFTSSIESAITNVKDELADLQETIASVQKMKSDCDKRDYALAASSGVLCGIVNIFLVGKPGESPFGDITDKWFSDHTIDFAKFCGWDGKDNGALSSAINFLEKKFKIPYDQRGAGDAGSIIFDLNPVNHHFKSLGHNPTLLGLFFSILDQFATPNQAHFISGGELIALQNADGSFELKGNSTPGKLFCGFVNWFGHLISDVSGSSGSKGRGMGIPSPFWAWTNDIITIKRTLKIEPSEFDRNLNKLALSIYKQGYDIRFQAAQAIPVLINEVLVRLIYAVRRMIQYFKITERSERSETILWQKCEPFSNLSVKRMLMVAHGVFCMMDIGDATIRGLAMGGGTFNVTEFALRFNIAGIGRFAISLYGEAKRVVGICRAESNAAFAEREKYIVESYLDALLLLSEKYADQDLVNFVDDFKNSDMYVKAFGKSGKLAELRGVPEEKILRIKSDIDMYFGGRKQ
ncbi:hypothetical protein [Pseudoramibacter alactolyticus]|uniref:hypothetical protein n=1 Tax=Pseudoramibacter alactolyticus TaxID=113287 RepID=UPI0028EDF314|nr:hypothetical protein [Pseudoramibacter alactolyticus]